MIWLYFVSSYVGVLGELFDIRGVLRFGIPWTAPLESLGPFWPEGKAFENSSASCNLSTHKAMPLSVRGVLEVLQHYSCSPKGPSTKL